MNTILRQMLAVFAVVAGLFPALAFATHVEEMRRLALAHDLAGLEMAFQARQMEFRLGQISEDKYRIAYSVFETTDPEIQTAAGAWLAAYPRSTQAMTARGLALSHLAYLYRSGGFAREIPRGALSKMHAILAQTIPLFSAAIEAEPSHLAAAYGLVSAAGFTSKRSARDRGLAVIRIWAERDRAIQVELRYTYKRWGGRPGATETYCADRTANARRLTKEQCLAIADFDQGINMDQALEVLGRGPVDMFLKYHIERLVRGNRLKEAQKLADENGYMTLGLARNLMEQLDETEPMERFVAENLKLDPLNPYFLSGLYELRSKSSDLEGAAQALDKAMVYGGHWPRLRFIRLLISPPDQAFAEILSALDATDYEIEVLAHSVSMLMLSTQIIGEEAYRPPDFECQRLRILEYHAAACKAGADHGSCTNPYKRDTIIFEARLNDACGVGGSKSWQDYIREVFGLDE